MMKILAADEHALFRAWPRLVVDQLEAEMLEAHDWQSALAAMEAQPDIDLALVDISMPGRDNFAGLADLLECAKTIPVMVSSSESDLDMRQVLDMGAVGYLAKSETAVAMLGAMRLVLAGVAYVPPRLALTGNANRFGLTARPANILRAMVQRKSNKVIAQNFALSVSTVKAHVGAIFKALNVGSSAEAVRGREGR